MKFPFKTNKYFSAFTLAEVLITLLIIGVVASLVIPAIVNDSKNAEFQVAYKKAFGDITQVFNRAKYNYEFVDVNLTSANVLTNIRVLENYFSITKICTDSVAQGCWTDNCINGEHECFWSAPAEGTQGKSEGFIDSAGRQWIRYKQSGWFIMLVDTNGDKKPNRLGRDRFPFFFNDVNGLQNAMAPVKVVPNITGDDIAVSAGCLSGNCLYISWLKQ
jgi:prepilin-type N-terminal cleavage/methylation domain-containing protein